LLNVCKLKTETTNSLSNIVFLDLSNQQQQQFDYHPILCLSSHDGTLVFLDTSEAFYAEPHFSTASKWHLDQPNAGINNLKNIKY
jgi:hypothetical protein